MRHRKNMRTFAHSTALCLLLAFSSTFVRAQDAPTGDAVPAETSEVPAPLEQVEPEQPPTDNTPDQSAPQPEAPPAEQPTEPEPAPPQPEQPAEPAPAVEAVPVEPQAVEAASAGPVAVSGGTGLRAEFFDNPDLTLMRVSRIDGTVNYYWHGSSPANEVEPDTFSARWTGQVIPAFSETYTFHVDADDGVRLWVNGQTVIDAWGDGHKQVSGQVAMTAGQRHDIRLEYFENGGSSTIVLAWSSPSQPHQIVPSHALFPGPGTGVPVPVEPPQVEPPPVEPPVEPPVPTQEPETSAPTEEPVTPVPTDEPEPVVDESQPTTTPDEPPTEPTPVTTDVVTDAPATDEPVQPTASATPEPDIPTEDAVPTDDALPTDDADAEPTVTASPTWTDDLGILPPPTDDNEPAAPAPTLTETPTETPTSPPASEPSARGLRAEFFDNPDLTNLRVTRLDGTVNYYWHNSSPANEIHPETFSARWTGNVIPAYSERYTFHVDADDGVRLWVDGRQVIDAWNDGHRQLSGSIDLVGGQRHTIRLEYFNNTGSSTITLSWSSASQRRQVVPEHVLIPAAITGGPAPAPTAQPSPSPTSQPEDDLGILPTPTPTTDAPVPSPTPTTVIPSPTPTETTVPNTGIPAPPPLPPASGKVIAEWNWSDPSTRIYPQPDGATETGAVAANDVAADGNGATTTIVNTDAGERVVEFRVNHDHVQRPEGTAARLFIRNWSYLSQYYGQQIQVDFAMRMPSLPDVPVNNPNLVYGVGQQFKHATGVIYAMNAERAPDGSGVSPYVWWPRGTGVFAPQAPFEYQEGVWHRVRINSYLHNTNGWVEMTVDSQRIFRFDGNVSEVWGGGIGLALYIRDIQGEVVVQYSDWRLQVLG